MAVRKAVAISFMGLAGCAATASGWEAADGVFSKADYYFFASQ